ncbi:MAG: hypothetical protein Q8L98_07440 [Chlamydiales bacterium]|nr:hypothetical protein [Chlamydiales bacterium]
MSSISGIFSYLKDSFLGPPPIAAAEAEDPPHIKEIEQYELKILANSGMPSWDLAFSYYEAAVRYQQIGNDLKACIYFLEYAEFVISYVTAPKLSHFDSSKQAEAPPLDSATRLIANCVLSLRRQELADQELEALRLLEEKIQTWETDRSWKYISFHCYPTLADMYLELGNIPKVIACYGRLARVQYDLAASLGYFQKALKVCQEGAKDPAVLESARELSEKISNHPLLRLEQYIQARSSTPKLLLDFSRTTVEAYDQLQMPVLAAEHLSSFEHNKNIQQPDWYFRHIFYKAANHYLSTNPPQFKEAAETLQGGDPLFCKPWVTVEMLIEASECYCKMTPPEHIDAAKCFISAADREQGHRRKDFLQKAMIQLHEAKQLAVTREKQSSIAYRANRLAENLSRLKFFAEAAEVFILAAECHFATDAENSRRSRIQAANAYAEIKEYRKAAQCWEKCNTMLVFCFYSENRKHIRIYWEKALKQSVDRPETPSPINPEFMDAFLLLSMENRQVFLEFLDLLSKDIKQHPRILHTLLLNKDLKRCFDFFSKLSSENKHHFPTVYRLLKMGIVFEKKEASFLLALGQFTEPFQKWLEVIELPAKFSVDIAKQKMTLLTEVILFSRKEKRRDLEQQAILFFQKHTAKWESLKLLNHHHFSDFAKTHLQLNIFPEAWHYLMHGLSFPKVDEDEDYRKYLAKELPGFFLSGEDSKIALQANKFSEKISDYSFGPDFLQIISSSYEKIGMYFLAAKHAEEAAHWYREHGTILSPTRSCYMNAAKLYLLSISWGCEEIPGERATIYAKARDLTIKCFDRAIAASGTYGKIKDYHECLKLFGTEDAIHKKYRHLLDIAWAKEVEKLLGITLEENYREHWLWKILVTSSFEEPELLITCLSLVRFPARQHETTMSYLIQSLEKGSEQTRQDIEMLLRKLTPSDAASAKIIETVVKTYFLAPEKTQIFSKLLGLLDADQAIQVLLYALKFEKDPKIAEVIAENLEILPSGDRREAIELLFLMISFVEPRERSVSVLLKFLYIPTTYRQDCVKQVIERWDDLRDLYDIDETIALLKYPINWKIPESNTYWIKEESEFSEPTKLLLALRAIQCISGRFPEKIRYRFSKAVDVGGVTRDCIAKLFQELYSIALPNWAGKVEEQGIIPQCKNLEDPIEQREQIKCYEALGLLFAFALDDDRTVRTGAYFHPALFQMLHELTTEDLGKIQSIPLHLYIDQSDSISVYNKLLKVFLQNTRYRSFFGETDLEINTAIDEFIQENKVPPSLQAAEVETKEAFLQAEGIHQILCATLCMAIGINNYNLNSSWEVLKGASYKDLALNIQGSVDKQLILASLKWDKSGSTAEKFLIDWIQEATPKDIQQFLHAISGSFALPVGRDLHVHIYEEKDKLPTFHTCNFSVDLSENYLDYPTFARQMATALEWIEKTGFSAK